MNAIPGGATWRICGADDNGKDDADQAAAIEQFLTNAELATARLSAGTLGAVKPGSTACEAGLTACRGDARSVAVATPAACGRRNAFIFGSRDPPRRRGRPPASGDG